MAYAGVDVGKRRIAIRMAVALLGLAVALQTKLLAFEQFAHDGMADFMTNRAQLTGQAA